MSGWRTVLRLEWRILRRDRAALAVLGLFAGFLVVAALAGGHHNEVVSQGQSAAVEAEQSRLSTLQKKLAKLNGTNTPRSSKDPRDPVWMSNAGAAKLVVLPPAPLASVAVGQRDLHPQAVRVNAGTHLVAEKETETAMSGPTRLRTGAFDPAFLFVVLFPLVVIALSYELLSGERERGTLAMLLSQPVSQISLVLGKAAARAIVLGGVTLVFALIGLLVAGADVSAPGAWLHMSLYAATLLAWAIFWFAAAVAVNAWGATSERNALLLVGVWLLLVIVVPGLVQVVVEVVHPAPSRIEMLNQAREAAQDVQRDLAGLQGRHDIDVKTQDYAKRVVAVQEQLASRSAPVVKAHRERLRQRHEVLDLLRFASPAIVVQLALEDVAGSGTARHRRFEEQVDRFHVTFRDHFFALIRTGEPFTPEDFAGLPQMAFVEEPQGKLALRVGVGVLGLLFAALALIAVALSGLRTIGRLT